MPEDESPHWSVLTHVDVQGSIGPAVLLLSCIFVVTAIRRVKSKRLNRDQMTRDLAMAFLPLNCVLALILTLLQGLHHWQMFLCVYSVLMFFLFAVSLICSYILSWDAMLSRDRGECGP